MSYLSLWGHQHRENGSASDLVAEIKPAQAYLKGQAGGARSWLESHLYGGALQLYDGARRWS